MKKPNITEGEWIQYSPHTNSSIYIKSDDQTIADIGFIKCREENAKAISAVPEMIDTLVRAKEMIEGERGRCPEWLMDTLKKAGCTDEK